MKFLSKTISIYLLFTYFTFSVAAPSISGGAALSSKFITQDALALGDESLQLWASTELTDTAYVNLWANIGDYDEVDVTFGNKWRLKNLQVNTNISYFSIPGNISIVVPEIYISMADNPLYFKLQHWNFTGLKEEDGMAYGFGYSSKFDISHTGGQLVLNAESKFIDRSTYDQGWVAMIDAKIYTGSYFIGTRIGYNRLNNPESHYQFLIGVDF